MKNISPRASLEEAAKSMRDNDCGILLVSAIDDTPYKPEG